MRLISQNGMIDVPYEMSAIRNDDGLIILCMAGETGKGSVIATYSTSEKAENAMEMLRESYNNYVFAINLFSDEMLKSYANSHSKEEFNELAYPYFQFPQDEDVEV